jgi:hypothetical protein
MNQMVAIVRLFVWIMLWLVMKRVVLILILILILIFRQASPVVIAEHKSGSRAILQETNLITSTPGFGWIETMDNSDPKEALSGFQTFHNEEQLISGAATRELFRFLIHCHSNPFLIDLPPPTAGA